MKRFFVLFLGVVGIVTIVGCGSQDDQLEDDDREPVPNITTSNLITSGSVTIDNYELKKGITTAEPVLKGLQDLVEHLPVLAGGDHHALQLLGASHLLDDRSHLDGFRTRPQDHGDPRRGTGARIALRRRRII